MASTTTFAAAFVEALHDGLSADPRASIVGGYVLGLGPERQLMDRIRNDFPDRVIDPPTPKPALPRSLPARRWPARIRSSISAPASFAYLAWSQIANEAAVAHYMTGGRLNVPVTFHFLHGVRGAGAAQHSHWPHAMLFDVPGLEIVAPSCRRTPMGWCARRWRARTRRSWSIMRGFSASKGRLPTTARRCRWEKPTSNAAAAT